MKQASKQTENRISPTTGTLFISPQRLGKKYGIVLAKVKQAIIGQIILRHARDVVTLGHILLNALLNRPRSHMKNC